MCGIFGFISIDGRGPDVSRLRRLALITQGRGAHAFGLAWLAEDGDIQVFKRPGPAQDYLDELDRCRDAVAVVGHCRFATHGSPTDNRNNHPHADGGGYFVHNGVILNRYQLVRQHRLTQRTRCDSEVLGLLMARCPGSIVRRSVWAANQVEGGLAMMGLWRAPARMLLCRRGRPLCFGLSRRGCYVASLPDGLPGRVRSVANRSARVLVYKDGSLSLDGEAVRLAAGGPRRGGSR